MNPNLYIAFRSDQEIRCSFLTLVVKTTALRAKYPGGINAFVQRYHGRCNKSLAVFCSMAGDELELPIIDLGNHGFTNNEDYTIFDAAANVLGYDMLKRFEDDLTMDVEFSSDWLKGRIDGGGVMLHYAG